MIVIASSWQVLPLLTLVGPFLGMLGSLYLAYDLFGRQPKMLHRLVFVFSYVFLFTSILLVSCMVFSLPEPPPILLIKTRLTTSIIYGAFMMQFLTLSPPPQARPSDIDRLKLVYWLILTSIGLVVLGTMIIHRGSNPVEVLIFALPGVLVMGALNGFSPAIQWWVLHLPERRVAAIGGLLIFCAFALAFVQPLLGLLGIMLQ